MFYFLIETFEYLFLYRYNDDFLSLRRYCSIPLVIIRICVNDMKPLSDFNDILEDGISIYWFISNVASRICEYSFPQITQWQGTRYILCRPGAPECPPQYSIGLHQSDSASVVLNERKSKRFDSDLW